MGGGMNGPSATTLDFEPSEPAPAYSRVFDGRPGDDYSALSEAVLYLRLRGFSYGPPDVVAVGRAARQGVLYGAWDIAEWRHLSSEDRARLHGTIAGDRVHGPITVTIFYSAPALAIAAAAKPWPDQPDRSLKPNPQGETVMTRTTTAKAVQKHAGNRTPDAIDQHLGARIRMRRLELELNQVDFGEQLGVSFQQVQKYEKGVNRVGGSRLHQIATALDVDVGFFYQGAPGAKRRHAPAGTSLMDDFLASKDGLIIARAFIAIADPEVRQRVARAIASLIGPLAGGESAAE